LFPVQKQQMRYAYSLAIYLYYLGIYFASFFNAKARQWIDGRKKIFRQIGDKVDHTGVIWIHVASLGEFEQGRPVIEEIRQHYSQHKILLTFFSPSGYEVRKNYNGADFIFYLPLDTDYNAKKFIKMVQPTMAIFVKYEFWYHYLHQLKQNHIPVYLISGIFRPQQLFFKWYGSWFRKILGNFNHFFLQNPISVDLLHSLSFQNVTMAGDTRFDRVLQIAAATREIAVASRFKGEHLCLVAGSTWPEDELLLIQYINGCTKPVKFIMAPHEIHEDHIQQILRQLKKPVIRFSEAENAVISDKTVLIIDNIGMLSSLYKYGDLAYIGGGFGKGIHNILEAAAFSLPVIFGPHYKKFNEAVELLETGAAASIGSTDQLLVLLNHWLDDK